MSDKPDDKASVLHAPAEERLPPGAKKYKAEVAPKTYGTSVTIDALPTLLQRLRWNLMTAETEEERTRLEKAVTDEEVRITVAAGKRGASAGELREALRGNEPYPPGYKDREGHGLEDLLGAAAAETKAALREMYSKQITGLTALAMAHAAGELEESGEFVSRDDSAEIERRVFEAAQQYTGIHNAGLAGRACFRFIREVLGDEEFKIEPSDTVGEVLEKAAREALENIMRTMRLMEEKQ